MSYPIINKKETYKGTNFYLDSRDFKNWLVAPADSAWNSSNPLSVGGRTIINARKEYMVSSELINEFSASMGNVTINPLSITGYDNKIGLDILYEPEHIIKLEVLDSMPYPSFIFSATLWNAAGDFGYVLQQITNKLRSNTLTKGTFTFSFKGIEVLNKCTIEYNLRKCLWQLNQGVKIKELTQTNFLSELREFVNINFPSIVATEFSDLSTNERDKVVDYLCNRFAEAFVTNARVETSFDGALAFERIWLREPAELEDKNSTRTFLNTKLIEEKLIY